MDKIPRLDFVVRDDDNWGVSSCPKEVMDELEKYRTFLEKHQDTEALVAPYLTVGTVINYLNGYGFPDLRYKEK